MADLITAAQYKTWASIGDSTDDTVIGYNVIAASQMVRGWCGRSFHVDGAQVASARYFTPIDPYTVLIDDCYNVSSLATDDADDGAWSTTWATTDYTLSPLDTVGPTGETGWPYTKIRACESAYFPSTTRPTVKLTAKWGWSALPGDVFVAALMVCGELMKSKSGGSEYFTTDGSFTPIRRNVVIRDMLQPYRGRRANDARFLVA
jgi:hypothetical protein